jgi:primosomal protein N' (replication factor Y)
VTDLRDARAASTHSVERCVEVALPVPLFRTFTYSVPAGVAWPVPAGARVVVPFRNRKEIGICLGGANPPGGMTLKPLHAVVDDVPSLPAPLIETARWIAEWYAAPLGLVVRGMLPASLTGVQVPHAPVKTRRVVRIVQELPSLLQRETTFARARQ